MYRRGEDGFPIPGPTLTLLFHPDSPWAGNVGDVVLLGRVAAGDDTTQERIRATQSEIIGHSNSFGARPNRRRTGCWQRSLEWKRSISPANPEQLCVRFRSWAGRRRARCAHPAPPEVQQAGAEPRGGRDLRPPPQPSLRTESPSHEPVASWTCDGSRSCTDSAHSGRASGGCAPGRYPLRP